MMKRTSKRTEIIMMAVTFKLEELLQARTSEDKAGKELTTQKS